MYSTIIDVMITMYDNWWLGRKKFTLRGNSFNNSVLFNVNKRENHFSFNGENNTQF